MIMGAEHVDDISSGKTRTMRSRLQHPSAWTSIAPNTRSVLLSLSKSAAGQAQHLNWANYGIRAGIDGGFAPPH